MKAQTSIFQHLRPSPIKKVEPDEVENIIEPIESDRRFDH